MILNIFNYSSRISTLLVWSCFSKSWNNFESFQAKLDVYRADDQRGKELNDDQKLAISKYEEVLQTLDFARELSGQFKTLIVEEDKTKKKLLKKEQLEKAKSEAQKLAQVLEIQVRFSFCFFISYIFIIFDL